MPITPRILLYSSTPSKFFLSQALLRTFASACGILRETQSNNENACSAVEMVFPPGAFNTTTPRRVAASTSTLSTPTPARPTTRSLLPAFKISAVTLVWLRTTSALNGGINSTSSRSFKPVLIVTCSAFSRASSSTPRCEMESAMRTFGEVTAILTFNPRSDLKKCHSERSEESLTIFWSWFFASGPDQRCLIAWPHASHFVETLRST